MVIALIYVLPLVVMLFAYSVIGLTLWRREVPRHQTHGASLRHLQAKKKVGAGGGARRGAVPLPSLCSAPPPPPCPAPRRSQSSCLGPASGPHPSGLAARPWGGAGENRIHPNLPGPQSLNRA